jgi:hypothetical protein
MVHSRRVTVARARPRASSSRANVSMSAADREQRHGPGPAPASELAQVECAGLSGQAAVPGQKAGEREPLGIYEHRLDRDEGGGVGRGGHRAPPGTAGTREAGPRQVPAVNDARNVRPRAEDELHHDP